ncbi:MAG: GFA family protein [Pseudomonadota bacterium]
MIRGECNCGEIAFEVTADTSDVFVCHCSICRKFTGSNGIAVVIVSAKDFQWTQGESLITTWRKPGHDWQVWFCKQCGSTLPGKNDETQRFIPAGSITEGANTLKVAHHIHVDSKATWHEIGDRGQQHPNGFNLGS